MGEFVGLQMALSDEFLAAGFAFEWPLSSVGSHVRLQISRLLELLQAFFKWAHEHFLLIFGPLDLLNRC